MSRIVDYFRGRTPRGETGGVLERETVETQLEMASALNFAIEIRNPRLGFVEHCTRVTRLVDRLATEVGLDGDDFVALRSAAQLHEIGMIAVPPELIDSPGPLTDVELDRVRAQSWIGAEIVRATHGFRTARLIETQYSDFEQLRREHPEGSRDILLAGILRVADVFDTMTHPRPYQKNLPGGRRSQVLMDGIGTKFHPVVVDTLFQVRPHLS
jgi:putative two-component system response regulator